MDGILYCVCVSESDRVCSGELRMLKVAVILCIKIYFRLISFWTVPRRRSSLAARIDSAGNR